MLTDTGPLLALLDVNDRHHASCVAVVRSLPNQPLMTTWLCFTEAIYFLGEEGGYHFQERLWKLRRDGTLALLELTPAEGDLMDALMAQYQNVPMDAADASLIAIAQSRSFRRLFTIDSDFYIYRLASALSATGEAGAPFIAIPPRPPFPEAGINGCESLQVPL